MARPAQDAGSGVAASLYSQLAKLPEGSEPAEIAERALSLVSRHRKLSGANVYFDVWRNARYSYRRSQARARRMLSELTDSHPTGFGLAASGGQRVPTPEEYAVAQDLEDRIRASAERLSPLGARCLEGMLIGEPAEETAQALAVSVSSVHRLRRAIRRAAGGIVGAGRR